MSRFDVSKVARLARLALEPEEEQRLAQEFQAILEFVEQVQSLPLDGVVPSVHALAPPMPMEADEPRAGLTRERALDCAPQAFEGFFQVPAIMDGKEEA